MCSPTRPAGRSISSGYPSAASWSAAGGQRLRGVGHESAFGDIGEDHEQVDVTGEGDLRRRLGERRAGGDVVGLGVPVPVGWRPRRLETGDRHRAGRRSGRRDNRPPITHDPTIARTIGPATSRRDIQRRRGVVMAGREFSRMVSVVQGMRGLLRGRTVAVGAQPRMSAIRARVRGMPARAAFCRWASWSCASSPYFPSKNCSVTSLVLVNRVSREPSPRGSMR